MEEFLSTPKQCLIPSIAIAPETRPFLFFTWSNRLTTEDYALYVVHNLAMFVCGFAKARSLTTCAATV
jgi:hypothetical protein